MNEIKNCPSDTFFQNFELFAITNPDELQKQPPTGVFKKRCYKNMQQLYRRTPLSRCDFNRVALQLY